MTLFVDTMKSNTEAINETMELANLGGQRADTARTATTDNLTAAQVVNGHIRQSGALGAFSLATPTAAAMIALIPNVQVGSVAWCWINNLNNNTITLTAGTGVTLVGTTTVATNKARLYMIRVTAATTVDFIGVAVGDV